MATASEDTTVKVWDSNNHWLLVLTFSGHSYPVRSLSFIDGTTIISGDSNGIIYRWSITTGAVLAQNNIGTRGSVFSMKKFSNLNQLVVGAGSYIYFYNIDANNWSQTSGSGNAVSFPAMTNGHQGNVLDLELAQNDTIIISSSSDTTIKIWSIFTYGANLVYTLTGHTGAVYGLKMVSPNILMSGSDDHVAMLWNINNGQLVQKLIGHTNSILWSVDSLDSNTVLSGSLDTTLKVWQLSTGSLIRTVYTGCQVETLALMVDLTGVYCYSF